MGNFLLFLLNRPDQNVSLLHSHQKPVKSQQQDRKNTHRLHLHQKALAVPEVVTQPCFYVHNHILFTSCLQLLLDYLPTLQVKHHQIHSLLLVYQRHLRTQLLQFGQRSTDVLLLQTFDDLLFDLKVLTHGKLLMILITNIELGPRKLANRRLKLQLLSQKDPPFFFSIIVVNLFVNSPMKMRQTSTLYLKYGTHYSFNIIIKRIMVYDSSVRSLIILTLFGIVFLVLILVGIAFLVLLLV